MYFFNGNIDHQDALEILRSSDFLPMLFIGSIVTWLMINNIIDIWINKNYELSEKILWGSIGLLMIILVIALFYSLIFTAFAIVVALGTFIFKGARMF